MLTVLAIARVVIAHVANWAMNVTRNHGETMGNRMIAEYVSMAENWAKRRRDRHTFIICIYLILFPLVFSFRISPGRCSTSSSNPITEFFFVASGKSRFASIWEPPLDRGGFKIYVDPTVDAEVAIVRKKKSSIALGARMPSLDARAFCWHLISE